MTDGPGVRDAPPAGNAPPGSGRSSGALPVRHGAPPQELPVRPPPPENFPVAARLLPTRVRRYLLAIYGFARLVDDVGDEPLPGNRRGASQVHDGPGRWVLLDWLDSELDRVFQGRPARHPVTRRLADTLREADLPQQPFRDLIAANRLDQQVVTYQTFEDLLGYCELSANPVGRLVLAVFGEATATNVRLSDRVCTALQLVEHCQDVAEDARRGRIYLPMEDLARFGCTPADLVAGRTPPRLRRLVAFEVTRTRELLAAGAPLIGRLRGTARVAVAGYVAGGRAALRAIENAGCDPLAGDLQPTSRDLLAGTVTAWWRGR